MHHFKYGFPWRLLNCEVRFPNFSGSFCQLLLGSERLTSIYFGQKSFYLSSSYFRIFVFKTLFKGIHMLLSLCTQILMTSLLKPIIRIVMADVHWELCSNALHCNTVFSIDVLPRMARESNVCCFQSHAAIAGRSDNRIRQRKLSREKRLQTPRTFYKSS